LNTDIKTARQAAGLTIAELAARTGLSPAVLAVAEKGGPIDLEAREKIAAALELDAEVLWPQSGPRGSNTGLGVRGHDRHNSVRRRGRRTP
jgi:transcriptional regulator with XRE-family HTH domain